MAKQKDPNAAPVPQPDNAEQELKVLKKEVIPIFISDGIQHKWTTNNMFDKLMFVMNILGYFRLSKG